MTTAPRNRLIERLRRDLPVFGGAMACGDIAGARSCGDSDLDYLMVDLEHEGFDMPRLGDTLQWMVSRRRMEATGEAFPSPTPIVRLPHHGNERISWIASQALDYGALGIVLPIWCGRCAMRGRRRTDGSLNRAGFSGGSNS